MKFEVLTVMTMKTTTFWDVKHGSSTVSHPRQQKLSVTADYIVITYKT